VLLYWGADWCPPCSRLKATVFRSPEFVERTRLFVAVNLDGDEPGAQRVGEEFDVYGYPTVVVLSPDREEITRVATTMDTAQYVHALDLALAASQPASAAYQAVLNGSATDSDLRLLAYYSWSQDKERLVPAARLPVALQALEAAYPDHLAVEKSRLVMAYLAARSAAASNQGRAALLSGDELAWARTRLWEILHDPALIEANSLAVVYGAHWAFAMVARPPDAGAEALAAAWEGALAGMRTDPATSAVTRIATLYGTLCLVATRDPGHPPPAPLVRAVHREVREADRATEDPYARMTLFSVAYHALSSAGLYDEAYDFMVREVERSHSPDYIMLALARWAQWEGLPPEALGWAERAWREAHGPATRFERGTAYVHMLAQLTPDAESRIEDTVIALFREASTAKHAFFLRTTRYLHRLEDHLRAWNDDGIRAASMARIRTEVLAICDAMADDGPSRATCRTFLADHSPGSPGPPI
jgi:thiol-disulfide isomerase/thioredoxin